MHILFRSLVQYLELVLTGLGLGICVVLIIVLPPNPRKWQMIAIASMGIGVTHGVASFWLRTYQQASRRRVIRNATYMLQAQVNSYVDVISRLSQSENHGHYFLACQKADELAKRVEHLSDDPLKN